MRSCRGLQVARVSGVRAVSSAGGSIKGAVLHRLCVVVAVTSQRCNELAAGLHGQQVGCIWVCAFKHQQHIAQFIGHDVQQLLALQAFKDGVAVSADK